MTTQVVPTPSPSPLLLPTRSWGGLRAFDLRRPRGRWGTAACSSERADQGASRRGGDAKADRATRGTEWGPTGPTRLDVKEDGADGPAMFFSSSTRRHRRLASSARRTPSTCLRPQPDATDALDVATDIVADRAPETGPAAGPERPRRPYPGCPARPGYRREYVPRCAAGRRAPSGVRVGCPSRSCRRIRPCGCRPTYGW